MSKKKPAATKKSAAKSKGKPAPHKTLKKTVQQTGKSANAETLSDIGAGKKVADAKAAKKSSGDSIKNRLLPPVLAEFEKDTKAGLKRSVSDIAELVGFDAKQVVKYVSHYEKETYEAWKSLPKKDAGDNKKAEKKAPASKKSGGKTHAKKSAKKEEPEIAEIPENNEEETTSEE